MLHTCIEVQATRSERLAAAIAASACKSEPAPPVPSPGTEWLSFEEISAWHYTNGLDGIPAAVQARSGTRVTMEGWVLPFDDAPDHGEALLVDDAGPWLRGRGDAPPQNGLVRLILPVRVELNSGVRIARCTGTFVVQATMLEDYCVDIYQLHVDRFEVLERGPRPPKDPARPK